MAADSDPETDDAFARIVSQLHEPAGLVPRARFVVAFVVGLVLLFGVGVHVGVGLAGYVLMLVAVVAGVRDLQGRRGGPPPVA